MAIETKPRRQRLPYPEYQNGHSDRVIAVTERPTLPELPPVPASSVAPESLSWRGFIFAQTSLLLAVALVFGIIAFAFIARAGNSNSAPAASVAPATTPAATTVAAATPIPTPTAVPIPATAARLPVPQVAPPVGQRAPQTVT